MVSLSSQEEGEEAVVGDEEEDEEESLTPTQPFSEDSTDCDDEDDSSYIQPGLKASTCARLLSGCVISE